MVCDIASVCDLVRAGDTVLAAAPAAADVVWAAAAPAPPTGIAADAAALGDWLAVPSVVVLWLAVLLRAPSAVRQPQQRGLLLAVATAAAAMTLNLPDLLAYAAKFPDWTHAVGLTRNLTGVLSAGAVLYFVATTTTRGRGLQVASSVMTVAWLGTLVALDLLAPPHSVHAMPPGGSPLPSLAYWLTLMSAHLAANTACVYVCWRYGRRAVSPGLSAGLRLFGLGTALAGVFWFCYLLKAVFGVTAQMPYMALLMNTHGLLRAAAILVPTLYTARRTVGDVRTAWLLWPLWRELVDAVPHVALHKPRATRLVELLWPPMTRRLLVYRRVIETRDAILVLGEYVAPGVPELARAYVALADPGAYPQPEAGELACVITEAARAKAAGMEPRPGTFTAASIGGLGTGRESAPGGRDLDAEKRFLIEVAAAHAAPVTRSFDPQASRK
ncbi:MAB_1171c family putative transporter [Streptomyces sp. NPDC093225]|uniref:MAB_1171c family putative transporter n=1 Tax=Streptomyces sp. NPDC093225 TaxID=3366034 RepID=UPI0037FB5E59